MNEKGRAKYEIVVVVIVVALAIAVAAGLYAARTKVFSGKRTMTELSAIRAGVALYMETNKSRPADLATLLKSTYNVNGVQRHYVEGIETNANGEPVDPFGKPLVYDAKRGLVSSASPGYEKW